MEALCLQKVWQDRKPQKTILKLNLVVSMAPSVKIKSQILSHRWIAKITIQILLRPVVSKELTLTRHRGMTLALMVTIWLKCCRHRRVKKCTQLTNRLIRESQQLLLSQAILQGIQWHKSMCRLADNKQIIVQLTILILWVSEKRA